MPAPILIIGVGNPSRGDDALGPALVERAEARLAQACERGQVELLTDFQLQVEHALDLAGRERVVFVDASVRHPPPFSFEPVAPAVEPSYTTHAMSPAEVLEVHRRVVGAPPPAWTLAIRGERFELGEGLSAEAERNLAAALDFLCATITGEAVAEGRRIEVEGVVQGVGFRPWVARTARRLGVRGAVWNTRAGVVIEATGPHAALDALVAAIGSSPPPSARVRAIAQRPARARDDHPFAIVASEDGGRAALVIPADLSCCEACLSDVMAPGSRFHRYPFTSCTDCGPRFSLTQRLPYDRNATTMTSFAPCATCASEYAAEDDRRFHSQTLACAACGPRVWLTDAAGATLAAADEAILTAAGALLAGGIVAVQGTGAFHLVCDATSAAAVALLRERKRRDAQPFAVMVRSEAEADALAIFGPASKAALCSPVRPIVLARSRPGTLAPSVCGPSARTGVMLPYTPLHHLLLAAVGKPVVFTSGNESGGPAVVEHGEAYAALRTMADRFLLHDRPIAHRVEDSVLMARDPVPPLVLRRGRGLAPLALPLARAAKEPILAVGGHMKNTACLVVGSSAYLTPHLGDLGLVESERAWGQELERFEALFGTSARVIAHDLHPDYASTLYAAARDAERRVGVQHHHAHALSVLAEHRVEAPALAVVYDGTGFGPDGTAWGAELLLVDGARYERVCSFRPLALAGGERAIRDVWRVAYAAVLDAYGFDEGAEIAARLPLFAAEPACAQLRRMIESGAGTIAARGMGRWFDAIAALVFNLPRAAFDAHLPILLEQAVSDAPLGPYPYVLPERLGRGAEIDLRPTVRGVVDDLLGGATAAHVATRFHRTIIDASVAAASWAATDAGVAHVVLAGGSFQNVVLERGIAPRLDAWTVLTARDVPCNDGGLALGQAWAAVLTS